jgi:hypothetical protein
MAASADPFIVDSTSRLRHLLHAGFGDYVERTRDWRTVRAACSALKKIGRVQSTSAEQNLEAKKIVTGDLIDSLAIVVRGDWLSSESLDDTKAWCCAAEQAIDAIFSISAEPDKVATDIVRALHHSTFESVMEEDADSPLPPARFFFVLGHVAMNLLLYVRERRGEERRGLGRARRRGSERARRRGSERARRRGSERARRRGSGRARGSGQLAPFPPVLL